MSLFHLKLRAMDLDQNIDRDYEILVSKILFGLWGVTIAFGRHGVGGTYRNHTFETKEMARAFVYKTIQKRLKAPKRIGCSYALVDARALNEERLSSWLTLEQQEFLKINKGNKNMPRF